MHVKIDGPLEERLRAHAGRRASRFVRDATERALDEAGKPDAPLVLLKSPGHATFSDAPERGVLLVPPPGASVGDAAGGVPARGVGEPPTPVRDAVWAKLAAQPGDPPLTESWIGQTALRTAYLLDTSKAVQGYAVLVKELRATMGQALGDLPAEEDDLMRILREKGSGA